MSSDGPQLLIDFEYTSVSSAVQDLAWICDDLDAMQEYLQEMLGRAPTTDEVEELVFESMIAYHIHYVLREVIFTKSLPHPEGKTLAEITVMLDSFLDHARSLADVVAVIRASPALRQAVVAGEPAEFEGGGCTFDKEIFLKMQALVKASTSDSQL